MAAGLLLAAGDARRGISTRRSACWSAAAACASATPASRCSCRTGSCAGAASRSASPSAGVGVGSIVLLPWLQIVIERDRLAHRLLGDGPARAGACWCRSTCCCAAGPRTWACEPDGDRRRGGRRGAQPRPTWSTRPGRRSTGRSARAVRTARFWWIALGYFCGALRLVRGAGAPDQVPDRDRLQPGRRGLGARRRQPGRHPRPDRARPPLGPHRPRMGVDRGLPGLRDLLRWRCSRCSHTRPRRCST